MTISKDSTINFLIALVLLAYPSLLLTVKGGMNGLYFLLALATLFFLYRLPRPWGKNLWDGYSIAFALAMASPILAIFLSQAYHGHFTAPPYDGPSRFLFAVPIYLALRQMDLSRLSYIQLGFLLGALVGLASLIIHPYDWPVVVNSSIEHFAYHRYTTGQFFNSVHFSDITLVIGFLSLASINMIKRDSLALASLKVLGCCAGLYLSIQAGERVTWFAAPVLAVVWLMSFNQRNYFKKISALLIIVIIIAWASYTFLEPVKSRISSIAIELMNFNSGFRDTSIGIRLQLWSAAWHLYLGNPIFGLGLNGFANAMTATSQSGLITPLAAKFGRGEVHNEILAMSVEQGIFGLISIVSIYLVPLVIFWRVARSEVQKRSFAIMGIGLLVAFFIFGLVNDIFNLKMTDAFFSLTLAVLMAMATNKSEFGHTAGSPST
jgi:O-antigen ligase